MPLIADPAPTHLAEDRANLVECFDAMVQYRGALDARAAAVAPLSRTGKVNNDLLPGNLGVATVAMELASSVQLERCTPLFLAASWKGVAPVVPRLNYDGDTPYFVLSRRGTGRCALASAADLYGKQYRNFRRRNAEKIEPRVAGGPARRFTARYWPASAAQPFRDAEFLLVNGLDAYLQRFLALAEPPASRRAGVVYLTTERLPCERCVETMRMFLADYPRFRLAIGFMHAHGAQQVSMIQAALGSRAALFGFAFA